MTNTNTTQPASKRDDARARLRCLVETQTGVEIESADFIECDAVGNRNRFAFTGNPVALAVVRYYFEHLLGVNGCEMAVPFADDPEWSCLWVPAAGIDAALARATSGASKRSARTYADALKGGVK